MNFNMHTTFSNMPSQPKTRAVFVEPNNAAIRQNVYQQGTFSSEQVNNLPLYNESYVQHQQFSTHSYNYPQTQLSNGYGNNSSPYASSYIPPDPFCNRDADQCNLIDQSNFADTSAQDKEKILEEILRECSEIERRSLSSESPPSTLSSEEHDLSYQKCYKTPEKRERKKAQNRLAATRYREKKRREKEETMTCIEGLSIDNHKLKDQVVELEREIRYFKKFMREMGMELTNSSA